MGDTVFCGRVEGVHGLCSSLVVIRRVLMVKPMWGATPEVERGGSRVGVLCESLLRGLDRRSQGRGLVTSPPLCVLVA